MTGPDVYAGVDLLADFFEGTEDAPVPVARRDAGGNLLRLWPSPDLAWALGWRRRGPRISSLVRRSSDVPAQQAARCRRGSSRAFALPVLAKALGSRPTCEAGGRTARPPVPRARSLLGPS